MRYSDYSDHPVCSRPGRSVRPSQRRKRRLCWRRSLVEGRQVHPQPILVPGAGRRGSPGSRGAPQLSGVRSLLAPVSLWFPPDSSPPNSANPTQPAPGLPAALGAATSLRSRCCCRYVGSPGLRGMPSGPISRAPAPKLLSSLLSSPAPLILKKFGSKGPEWP